MTKRKIRLALLYGGRSAEHAVSVVSARSVIEALDPDRFEVVPIGITRDGSWVLPDIPPGELVAPEGGLPEFLENDVAGLLRPAERRGVGNVEFEVERLQPLAGGLCLGDDVCRRAYGRSGEPSLSGALWLLSGVAAMVLRFAGSHHDPARVAQLYRFD